jgi:hypothetical protein
VDEAPDVPPEIYRVTVPSGYYYNEKQFIDALNERWETHTDEKPLVKFHYNAASRKCSITLNPTHPKKAVSISLPPKLGKILGFIGPLHFSVPQEETHAHRPGISVNTKTGYEFVNIQRALHSMFVYTDIINYVPVGDALAPLLRIVCVGSAKEEVVSQIFNKPYYVPVCVDELSTIEISIRSTTGEKVNFMAGSVTAVLHFKRV